MAEFNALGHHRHLEPGESLIWEDDESVVVANVIDGVLKVFSSTADGREQIVGIAFPSDFLGRPFNDTARHGVTALTKAHVCVFPRAEFDRFIAEHPAMERSLLERTLTELDRLREWMLLLSRKTAEEKVASFLLEMATRLGGDSSDKAAACRLKIDTDAAAPQMAASGRHDGVRGNGFEDFGGVQGDGIAQSANDAPAEFEMPFSRQQVADILGLTIETVSRQMSRFKRHGVIDLPTRRRVIIRDVDRLAQYTESAA